MFGAETAYSASCQCVPPMDGVGPSCPVASRWSRPDRGCNLCWVIYLGCFELGVQWAIVRTRSATIGCIKLLRVGYCGRCAHGERRGERWQAHEVTRSSRCSRSWPGATWNRSSRPNAPGKPAPGTHRSRPGRTGNSSAACGRPRWVDKADQVGRAAGTTRGRSGSLAGHGRRSPVGVRR